LKPSDLSEIKKPYAYLGIFGKPYLVRMRKYEVESYEPEPFEKIDDIPLPPISYLRHGWVEVI
jgi:hypothetical protein